MTIITIVYLNKIIRVHILSTITASIIIKVQYNLPIYLKKKKKNHQVNCLT